MSRRTMRGFTLVELIMVIVITGIMAATLTIFLKPVIDSYFDTRRRADLTDIADTALRRMAKDIRSAVPNSIRPYKEVAPGGTTCFELVPTSAGGRYRMAPDTVNDSAPNCVPSAMSATCSAPFDGAQAVTFLDILSPLWDTTSPPAVLPVVAGDWLVIDNQNTNDVYQQTNREAISTVDTPNPNPLFGRHRITLVADKQFPVGYDGGRFVVVPDSQQAVFYVCSNPGLNNGNGTGTLSRVAHYGFNSAAPTACPSGGDVVATNVASCKFVYDPNQGATQQSGFVWMQLQLSRSGESVTLAHGVHVDNVP